MVTGADAVVFAAGAGPGSGAARKDTVDRAAAVLLADAAERAGVRRYLLVSSMGVEPVADGARRRRAWTRSSSPTCSAKLAAEEDVLARPGLAHDGAAPGLAHRRARHRPGDARPAVDQRQVPATTSPRCWPGSLDATATAR